MLSPDIRNSPPEVSRDDRHRAAVRGIDIHADSPLGAYRITDDELTALRAAARLTLTSSENLFDLDGALRTVIVLAAEVQRLRDEHRG
jgi:hypothetical protein